MKALIVHAGCLMKIDYTRGVKQVSRYELESRTLTGDGYVME
jgi:hypothetical protein